MSKKSNNEGSVRRRSNGIREGRYSDGFDEHGKQIQRSVYGKTKQEVDDKLHTILIMTRMCIKGFAMAFLMHKYRAYGMHSECIRIKVSACIPRKNMHVSCNPVTRIISWKTAVLCTV